MRLGGRQVSSCAEKAGVCELGGEVPNMENRAWWRQTGCRAALPGQTRCGDQAQQHRRAWTGAALTLASPAFAAGG